MDDESNSLNILVSQESTSYFKRMIQKFSKFIYIGLCLIFLGLSIFLYTIIYLNYISNHLGYFISIIIFNIFFLFICITNWISKGLLPPTIICFYTTFLL